jgi:hypothetical protein
MRAVREGQVTSGVAAAHIEHVRVAEHRRVPVRPTLAVEKRSRARTGCGSASRPASVTQPADGCGIKGQNTPAVLQNRRSDLPRITILLTNRVMRRPA